MVQDLPVLPADDPCRGCGACCLHLAEPPFVRIDDPEWERLQRERPDLVAEIESDFARRHPGVTGRLSDPANRLLVAAWLEDHDGSSGPCLWYDPATRRCRHYEYRPADCREFEPGEKECLRTRKAVGID